MMKSIKILVFILMIGLLSSCGFDRYNAVTADTPDLREGDTRVYGESEDAPPRQAALEYPQPEDATKRANAIKKKWLGLDEETQESTTPAADSTSVEVEPLSEDSTAAE